MKRRIVTLLALCLTYSQGEAAITISNIVDKTKYNAPQTFTITADPNAATTTATLDGLPTTIGSPVVVAAFGYHELRAQSRAADGGLVDSRTVRFITRDPGRGDTEDGIPPHTPFRVVNDAPSAFAGKTLKVVAPAAWPAGLPIPLAVKLRDAANETVRLNGTVTFAGFPQTSVQMRRGWGSVVAPAISAPGQVNVGAAVHGAAAATTIAIESAPAFTNVSGTIGSNTTWPVNSRIHVTGTLTINAGATLTVQAGTIVTISTGDGTAGSAAEIVVNGTLQVNGSESNPVVIGPDSPGAFWGGIELPAATSQVNATWTIFFGSGEDAGWFNSHSGYSTHKPNQALFLISGSGAGTSVGAQLHLADCSCFSLAGQVMNSKTNTWIDLQRTLMQRAITCGELNGSKVTIDRSALMEFPSEDATFADADNDAIYFTNGDLSLTNSVIGFSKDDGVDSGGNGGDNPYTAAADVTPYLSQNNWYEGTYHEGNSLSGTRNVTFNGCVFFNCGQGVEDGYSSGATADGPNATVDGCLFASNMVGVRWGDNYGSGFSYNASMEVKNSLILYSLYRDAFSGQWHPTQANAWIYQDATAMNSFGRPYFNLHNNYLSQPDPLHHPANTAWNPANPAQTNLLAPFMPVPGSAVGVAISSYAAPQSNTTAYPGTFTVRLSTFSSREVTVNWSVIGKPDALGDAQSVLANGALVFAPGETLKTISAPVANPGNYELVRVALNDAINAEVTGEAWYLKPPTADPHLVSTASPGWRYREARSEPPSAWKQLTFDDSSAAATEWQPATLPAGFGVSGVTFGTQPTRGPDNDITRAFYFRKKFNVEDASKIVGLSLRMRRDDAAAVWLNNDPTPTVISADGAFNPPFTYAMTGTTGAVPNSSNTDNYLSYPIPPSKLVTGDNILAIEVHQSSLNSSDLMLDCELLATYNAPFELHVTRVARLPVLFWFDPGATLEETTDFSAWRTLPGVQSPVTIDLSLPQQFFRLRR